MKFYFMLLILAAFTLSVNAQISMDTINEKSTLDSSRVIAKIDTAKHDTSESLGKQLPQLLPDREIRNKISDIFSVSKIIWAVIFLIISYYVIRIITTILDKFSEKSTRYRIGLKGVIPIIRIVSWTAVISIVIGVIFAPPIESLVVVTGSLGIAVGLGIARYYKKYIWRYHNTL